MFSFFITTEEHGEDTVGDVVGFLLSSIRGRVHVFDLYFLDAGGCVGLGTVVHALVEEGAVLVLEDGSVHVGD